MRQSVPRYRCDDASLGIHTPNAIVIELGDEQVSLTVRSDSARANTRFCRRATIPTKPTFPCPSDR